MRSAATCRSPEGSSTSAWRTVTTSPARPRTTSRTQPETFCRASSARAPVVVARRAWAARRRPARAARTAARSAPGSASMTDAATQPSSAKPGSCTAGSCKAQVGDGAVVDARRLRTAPKPARHEASVGDRARPRRRPRAARARRCGRRRSPVRRAKPKLPRYQPSATASTMTFVALAQQRGDIDRVDEDALLVRGPAGGEQRIGRAHAVDPGVDEAQRAEAQARRRGRAVERELACAAAGTGPSTACRDADDATPRDRRPSTPASTTSGSLHAVQPAVVATRTAKARRSRGRESSGRSRRPSTRADATGSAGVSSAPSRPCGELVPDDAGRRGRRSLRASSGAGRHEERRGARARAGCAARPRASRCPTAEEEGRAVMAVSFRLSAASPTSVVHRETIHGVSVNRQCRPLHDRDGQFQNDG